MPEPTDAERARVWDIVEWQISEEMVKPEVDWSKLAGWARELAEHVESFAGPGA